MKKSINVRGGQIFLDIPEDIPALHNMLDNIFKKTKHSFRIITKRNEQQVDQELREYSAAEFEKVFRARILRKGFWNEIALIQSICGVYREDYQFDKTMGFRTVV